ncbi:chymotrypsin B-like isoform X2 [Argopecten irradians]|uniref:chymotrypsin B-like isoform X2 n=1 Tax=Argopecten irradians TaxID=31199 RepID=UPI003713878E
MLHRRPSINDLEDGTLDGTEGKGDIAAIIGGTNATHNAWPWHVSIKYRGRFRCGGTLLNANTVLTAAHCISDKRPRRYRITAGDYNRRNPEPHRSEQAIRAKKIFIHERYNIKTLINDVAILKLRKPVQFGTYIQPIGLAKTTTNLSQSTCYITGWGMRIDKDVSSMADVLQQTIVTLISNEECDKGVRGKVTEDMICTEDPNRATCYGDSGGPLQCKIKSGKWVQVGITSWGNEDCLDGPAVYSRITHNRAWIVRRM